MWRLFEIANHGASGSWFLWKRWIKVGEQVEKLTEAVTDLQKAQEYIAVAIQSVVQKVEDIVKSVDVLKNHLSPHAQPQIVKPPPSKRIPSELSVSQPFDAYVL
jgi:hypothetical protein